MPILFDAGPAITVEEFRLIRDLVNKVCGISFQDASHFTLERKLRERLEALDLPTFSDYYHYLRYHPNASAEIERAVELLTTNETYFFREDYQLKAFRQEILPALRKKGEDIRLRRLAIWSAGCSTGEEVYTLAILLHHSGMFRNWDVRIFGNDISRSVLQTARRATYGPSSFRAMPREYERYFVKTPDGLQVHPSIRSQCHFGHLNLKERQRTAIVGRVDAVFCRNVLIYFDSESRKEVLGTFYDRLLPGGYLLLGHSESLINETTAFELVHLKGDLVYRRPDVPQRAQAESSNP